MAHVGQKLALGDVGRLGGFLGLLQDLFGQRFGQGHGQITGQPLPQGDPLGSEAVFAAVVQLQQPQPVLAHSERDQGHRLVSLIVAAHTAADIALVFRDSGPQFRCAVGPEAPAGREERLRGVELPADHVAAHALDARIAGAIADGLARTIAGTERVLFHDELGREPAGLVVRVVVVLFQPDADGLATGFLLKECHRAAKQVVLCPALIHQAEEARRDLAFLFVSFASVDVAGNMHRTDQPALLIEAGRGADQEVSAQTRLMHFRRMFPAILAGFSMWAESGLLGRAMNHFVAVQSDALLGRHSQPLGHRAVGANNPMLIVEDGHEVRDGVEGLLPIHLGAAHGFLRPFASVDFRLERLVGCEQGIGALLLADVDDHRTANFLLPLARRGGDAFEEHIDGLGALEEPDLTGLFAVCRQHSLAEIRKLGTVF